MCEKLILYFRKIKRAKKLKRKEKQLAPYLKKDFGVELNYKLWTTKGARFAASHRNRIRNKLSSQTIGYLSAYLIIISLVHIYKLPFFTQLSISQLGFTTTALSIIILLYSQFENANNYAIKSEKFHQCALEIAELYNELRMIKTFKEISEKENQIKRISKQYDTILKQYENHLPIDSLSFKNEKPKYFGLNKMQTILIEIRKFISIRLKYYVLIYTPVLLFGYYQYKNL